MKDNLNIKESNVRWEGKKIAGKHEGSIALKDGFFEIENDIITGGKFTMDMESINTTDLTGETKDQLDGHLKSDDFFGVEAHPTATLVFTETNKNGNTYTVKGDLTIKKKTNPVTFDMTVNGNTANAKIVIDRSKYDVRYGSGSFFDNLGDKAIHDKFTLDAVLKF